MSWHTRWRAGVLSALCVIVGLNGEVRCATPSNAIPDAGALIVDDDATLGHGTKVMVVFIDHGSEALRAQMPHIMKFSDRHPEWIVDIKETPVLNTLSLVTAEAEESVIHQQNPERWRQFETWLDSQKDSALTRESLRDAASRAGLSMPDYDRFIADHHALALPAINRTLMDATKLHQMPVFFAAGRVVVGIQSDSDLEALASD